MRTQSLTGFPRVLTRGALMAGVLVAGMMSPEKGAAQTQPIMMMTLIPLTPVTLIPLTPVYPAAPVMAPVMASPVAMAPQSMDPDDPPGNMLSRLIGSISVGPANEELATTIATPVVTQPTIQAVPVVLVPAAPSPQGVYTVRSGGSLTAVAKRTGATLEDIQALNPTIPAGQRLSAGAKVWLPFPWPQ